MDAAEHPERSRLADPPTEEEVMEATRKKRKGGKAGGNGGILPEMSDIPEMLGGCGGETRLSSRLT